MAEWIWKFALPDVGEVRTSIQLPERVESIWHGPRLVARSPRGGRPEGHRLELQGHRVDVVFASEGTGCTLRCDGVEIAGIGPTASEERGQPRANVRWIVAITLGTCALLGIMIGARRAMDATQAREQEAREDEEAIARRKARRSQAASASANASADASAASTAVPSATVAVRAPAYSVNARCSFDREGVYVVGGPTSTDLASVVDLRTPNAACIGHAALLHAQQHGIRGSDGALLYATPTRLGQRWVSRDPKIDARGALALADATEDPELKLPGCEAMSSAAPRALLTAPDSDRIVYNCAALNEYRSPDGHRVGPPGVTDIYGLGFGESYLGDREISGSHKRVGFIVDRHGRSHDLARPFSNVAHYGAPKVRALSDGFYVATCDAFRCGLERYDFDGTSHSVVKWKPPAHAMDTSGAALDHLGNLYVPASEPQGNVVYILPVDGSTERLVLKGMGASEKNPADPQPKYGGFRVITMP